MTPPVKVGIVGCGAHAQLALIPALKHNSNAELVAVCDQDIRKLNHVRRLHKVPRHYQDFDDFKADEGIDAVIIATPNHLHAPMAVAAMEYGKHVLVETPMALNAEEAELMIRTARREKRMLTPCLNTRLRPDVQTIRRFIDGRELGDLYYCKTGWLQGRESWALSGWRGQRIRAGGGVFLSLGTPLLDFALWLLEPHKPKSITGMVHHRTGPSDVEDTAFAMIRFDSELLLTVEVGWSLSMDNDFRYFNAFGSAGAALLNPIQIHKEMHGHLVNVTPRIETQGLNRASHRLLIDLWVESMLKEKPLAMTAEDGLLISRLADAFYESSSTGREVTLPSDDS